MVSGQAGGVSGTPWPTAVSIPAGDSSGAVNLPFPPRESVWPGGCCQAYSEGRELRSGHAPGSAGRLRVSGILLTVKTSPTLSSCLQCALPRVESYGECPAEASAGRLGHNIWPPDWLRNCVCVRGGQDGSGGCQWVERERSPGSPWCGGRERGPALGGNVMMRQLDLDTCWHICK